MYFNKISLRRSADSLKKLNQYIHKNGYYYHQLIWDLFAENNCTKARDFIYRSEFDRGWPVFYAVSRTEPIDEQDIWEINSRTYQPKIKKSDFLYFMLRVNPRICRKNETGKHSYFDVVQDAYYHQKNSVKNQKSKVEIIQEVGVEWLNSRSEKNGFIISSNTIVVDNFQKHNFVKEKTKGKISFSTIDLKGQLKVTGADQFIHTLYNGIGAAKGFGCGLLMVKR